jgi:hypothetical protein
MKLAAAVALATFIALPAAGQDVTATAHVVITGGPRPGTYDLTVSKGGCSTGATGAGSFGTQVSDSKVGPEALGSVQLIVPAPSANGSTALQLVVRIGSILKKTAEFNINTLSTSPKPLGKGSVKVAGVSGSTPTATFDVTTADNVHIEGTVSCKSITHL